MDAAETWSILSLFTISMLCCMSSIGSSSMCSYESEIEIVILLDFIMFFFLQKLIKMEKNSKITLYNTIFCMGNYHFTVKQRIRFKINYICEYFHIYFRQLAFMIRNHGSKSDLIGNIYHLYAQFFLYKNNINLWTTKIDKNIFYMNIIQ